MSKKNVEWEWKKLGDVCDFNSGYTPKKNELLKEGLVPYFKVSDMNRVANSLFMIESDLYVINPKKIFKRNSIVFPKNGGAVFTNKKRILAQESVIDLNSQSISTKKENTLSTSFLYLFFQTIDLKDFSKGAALPTLEMSLLKNIEIPIPPLDEQERIVKVLDDAFEKIDAIKTTAETNLQNAKDLFQTTIDKIIDEECIQYERITLKEITTKIGSGATPKGGQKSYQARGISLIRSLNVHHGLFSYDDLAHINEIQAKALDGVTIQKNDVLFNITGASIARCCVVPDDVIPARVNQHVSILRPNKDLLYSKYLSVIMLAPQNQKILIGVGEAGATRQALTKADLESFQIPLPPLSIQKQIVAKLDSLSEKVKQLESNHKQVLADCDELKKALLKQAFEGML